MAAILPMNIGEYELETECTNEIQGWEEHMVNI